MASIVEESIAKRHVSNLTFDDASERRSDPPAVDQLLGHGSGEQVDVLQPTD